MFLSLLWVQQRDWPLNNLKEKSIVNGLLHVALLVYYYPYMYSAWRDPTIGTVMSSKNNLIKIAMAPGV